MVPMVASKKPIVSGDLKAISDALNSHTQYAQRVWAFAAIISCFVFVADPQSKDTTAVLGFEMPIRSFFPTAATILAALNLTFCAAELRGQRTHRIFVQYLKEWKPASTKITSDFTAKDFVYSLTRNNFNSMSPFEFYARDPFKRLTYLTFKIPADTIYYFLPISGCFFAIYKAKQLVSVNWCIWSEIWTLGSALLHLLAFLSLLATLMVVHAAYDWIARGPALPHNR
jgi:hypothetical protein